MTPPPFLPDELLGIIFQHYQSSVDRVLPWLVSSRRLYNIASPVLYRHISLRLDRVHQLHQCLASTPAAFQYTRSLTIVVPWHSEFRDRQRSADDCWILLEELIRKMENLRSFSIIPTTPYSMYSRYYSATASRKMLSQVLLALPPTVTSLEIAAAWDWDTNRSKSTPCCEGCNSIREILPRLRHIRLRMPCLCMGLLSPFTDETRPLLLERAVIWLSGRPTVNIFPCGTQVRLVDDETKSWNQAKPLRQAVVSDALRLYLSGALPHIQQFTFLDTKTMWGNPVDPDLDMVLKYDIINGETSAYPMSSVYDWRGSGSHNHYILRLPDPSTEQDVPHPGVKDYVGLYNSLMPILEGPTGWTQAFNGSRLPCALTELSGYEGGYTFHATPGCTHSTELLSRIGHAGSFWTEGAGNLQPAKAPCLPGNVVIERSGPELEDGSRAYAVVVQPYPEAPAIAP